MLRTPISLCVLAFGFGGYSFLGGHPRAHSLEVPAVGERAGLLSAAVLNFPFREKVKERAGKAGLEARRCKALGASGLQMS